jgi:hypothetical protein
MLILSHRFAGITFRSELDTRIPYLEYKHFEKFRVKNTAPDVIQRYQGISLDSLSTAGMRAGQEKLITDYVDRASWYSNSPLLNSPVVWELLESRRDHSHSITVEVQSNSVSIFDFAMQELNIFYTLGERERLLGESRIAPDQFATFLTLFSAIMVHSSGLILNNKTAVFLAPDEGGKTTVVRQALSGTVLCDDQVVLRKQGESLMAYGSPWGLITDPCQTAKLGGFFLLEQAEQFELILAKPAVVFDYLWKEHEHYRFFLPKNLRVQTFNLLYAACQQAPCYRMRFPKDYINWDAIEHAMN